MKDSPFPFADMLTGQQRRWLVTGVAGFIGSNLLEALLRGDQEVVGLDNLSTGHLHNLDEVRRRVGEQRWERFHFLEADIRDRSACAEAVHGTEIVLHQAALGSVPRSLEDPLTSLDVNITGFLNVLDAARRAGVSRFIYAASSSTYGDEVSLPKREERIGRCYGFRATGLRYFNVFGPRQDPNGAYAAVIPKWTAAMLENAPVTINGDGETSRDFCYVANAVQANLRAALAGDEAQGEVYNVAAGGRTSLIELFDALREQLSRHGIDYRLDPLFADFRPGDVRHSQADISKARGRFGFEPTHDVNEGIAETVDWYVEKMPNLAPL